MASSPGYRGGGGGVWAEEGVLDYVGVWLWGRFGVPGLPLPRARGEAAARG